MHISRKRSARRPRGDVDCHSSKLLCRHLQSHSCISQSLYAGVEDRPRVECMKGRQGNRANRGVVDYICNSCAVLGRFLDHRSDSLYPQNRQPCYTGREIYTWRILQAAMACESHVRTVLSVQPIKRENSLSKLRPRSRFTLIPTGSSLEPVCTIGFSNDRSYSKATF